MLQSQTHQQNELSCPDCGEKEFIKFPNDPGFYRCIYCMCRTAGIDSQPRSELSRRENLECPTCDKGWRTTREGDHVCPSCGIIKRFVQLYDRAIDLPQAAFHTYKRSFYFNERLSQYNGDEPEIPPYLRLLLFTAYEKACIEGLVQRREKVSYEHTRKICRSVSIIDNEARVRITEYVSQFYGSKKFKKKPLKNLLHFAEKWVTLNRLWVGIQPVGFNQYIISSLRQCFSAYQRPFDIFRHEESCNADKTNDKYLCHKSHHKCRYAIININLLISIFLLKADVQYGSEEYNHYISWWPQLNIDKRVKLVEKYILNIEKYLHGKARMYDYIPHDIKERLVIQQ